MRLMLLTLRPGSEFEEVRNTCVLQCLNYWSITVFKNDACNITYEYIMSNISLAELGKQ
jgi:hypothetical protein